MDTDLIKTDIFQFQWGIQGHPFRPWPPCSILAAWHLLCFQANSLLDLKKGVKADFQCRHNFFIFYLKKFDFSLTIYGCATVQLLWPINLKTQPNVLWLTQPVINFSIGRLFRHQSVRRLYPAGTFQLVNNFRWWSIKVKVPLLLDQITSKCFFFITSRK